MEYFGTDGIRGIANEELSPELAYSCGNALASLKPRARIVIGRDTRISGDMLMLSFASGAAAAGADVTDAGVIPTAGVAYITRTLNFDYGVVISASHNPYEYNGIKIFDRNGYKLSEEKEAEIESALTARTLASPDKIGRFTSDFSLSSRYENYLCSCISGCSLKGLNIVIDCSNGASGKIAPEVFRKAGANLTVIGADTSGLTINDGCGSLFPEKLTETVLNKGADCGFAYDGDADRLIACDEKGNIIDGDILIYILAKKLKSEGRLVNNLAVGTAHTNLGAEEALKNIGITLLRSDIGDKYVLEMMLKENAVIGGEQSGHIIFSELSTTGDGILSSLLVAEMLKNAPLSALNEVELYHQVNISIKVKDKLRIMNNEGLENEIHKVKNILKNKGRVLVRASGTEPKIRIFAESKDYELSFSAAKQLEKYILNLE